MRIGELDKDKLFTLLDDYYKSYFIPYERSKKNRQGIVVIVWIMSFLTPILITTFIPLIPLGLWHIIKTSENLYWPFLKKFNFFELWGLLLFAFILLNRVLWAIYNYLNRYELDEEIAHFCLLSEAIHEFNSYKINDNKSQYFDAIDTLVEYVIKGNENRIYIQEYDIVGSYVIHSITVKGEAWDVVKYLSQCVDWISFDENTHQIANALRDFNHQAPQYLEHEENVTEIFEAVKYLQLYAFLDHAKPDDVRTLLNIKYENIEKDVQELKKSALVAFSNDIGKLKWEKDRFLPIPTLSKYKMLKRWFSNVFLKSENIIILLAAWLMLSFLVFGLLVFALLFLSKNEINIDYLMQYFVASTGAGVLIATTIYTKNKKDKT